MQHTRKRALNPCAKTVTIDNPYEIWQGNGWTWLVLKKWQVDDNKQYARWFCAVQSPYTYDGYDYGDVYVTDVKQYATRTK